MWDHAHHGCWDDAVKGSALLRRLYEEVGTLNCQPTEGLCFDMFSTV